MTDLSAEERARVIQADRDAAADYLDACGWDWGACGDIREGRVDHLVVQALARYRIAFEAAAIERAAQVAERAAEQALATSRQGSGHGYERLGIRADAAAKIAAAIRQLHSGEGAGRGSEG